MKFKITYFKTLIGSAFILAGSSLYAVPNINSCTQMVINANPELLSTDTQAKYEKSLSSILSELRPSLAANIANNPEKICHILKIKTDSAQNDVINMYIDHMNTYLYAVTVTKNNVTSYYGDADFLKPIQVGSKQTFSIEYTPYTAEYLNGHSAQKLGMEMQNQNNDMNHGKNIFFNALTILEASKMPSVEAAMTYPTLWNTDGTGTMLTAKKNYLQQYKCSQWQIAQGQTTAQLKYTFLVNSYNDLNDGIKAAYDLTQWYSKCGTSTSNCMSYITPSYAPQVSRNPALNGHPCTKN